MADTVLIPHLTELINSIVSRDCPTEGYIFPIHKKGKDPMLCDNFRGIITPVLSKLLEHVILARIEPDFQQSPIQYGFTNNLSSLI